MNQSQQSIFITGGAGFIGTNFIRSALGVRLDWNIVNLDKLTYAGQTERYRFAHGGRNTALAMHRKQPVHLQIEPAA